jgi:ubiquitin carboxyl-terminal hydrolase 10
VTPLIYATIRFLDEFAYKEKPSLTKPDPEKAPKGKAKEDDADNEENGDVDSLMPTYVYDAMKEKRRFVNMKVRSYARAVAFCHRFVMVYCV